MSRSVWKFNYLDTDFLSQQKSSSDYVLFNRATYITEKMVGMRVHIYNGVRFFPLVIDTDMIGHRLGDFAPTRKKPIPKKKAKAKK